MKERKITYREKQGIPYGKKKSIKYYEILVNGIVVLYAKDKRELKEIIGDINKGSIYKIDIK